MNRKRFFLLISVIVLFIGFEVGYLTSRPNNKTILNNFLHVSTLSSPAFYLNTPYLRHRDLKNIDRIFSLHPALRESKIGTFILSSPVRAK